MNLHCGYGRRETEALVALLGYGFFDRKLSVSMARPFIEVPGPNETIETHPIPRLAIVIEGDADKLQPVLAALQEVRS